MSRPALWDGPYRGASLGCPGRGSADMVRFDWEAGTRRSEAVPALKLSVQAT